MARIAVIGAGMGALATAARLAVGGRRVAVYERSATYGGGVGRFARDGFTFDTGPALLHLPAVYRDLFIKTGREPLESRVGLTQVDPASRHLFPDGRDVSLPNASRAGVISALDGAFGAGAGERWSEVMGRARGVWEATRRPLLEDALTEDTTALGRDPYPAVRRGLFRRTAPSLASVAGRELRDPRLAALLESYALAHGFDPRSVPAGAVVLPYMEQTFGAWYVQGGMRALADAVYERCLARGVEFHFDAEVRGIKTADGRACGLDLADGASVDADLVVAGAPLPTPGEPSALTATPRGPGSTPGRFVVCLALHGHRPEGTVHRTVVHAADAGREWDAVFSGAGPCDSPTVTVLRPDDPSTVPDASHEAVTLQVTVAATAGPEDWAAPGVAAGFAEQVVKAAEAAVPGLRERELWREVRTPADTERETGAPGGAVPGPALAGAGGGHLRPDNRSPVPGLYFVGGWAHPGGGLAHAGMSGAIVADLIAGGPGGSR
ncbi:NAD(P)/FAD-dependent oxidoreductase [Streptomyces sp. H10-C2]|uniref:phytoene desaturase family protein n=1 Tax=unclassified Streptomyces TaxID=2593676 RepID=UPI0024B9D9A3|nr:MULTISPECIES: NAD(P)/FAD-dependent oxidoreductase [unclassified Streptomyces]MDJ0341100.1 NAD(P)/FAD-dependent oxidoreductase [Streptomyces sp. PH10-H1]MDJ0369548.1 NAD(P)/FAD-dependent oxidoreductase [Streptomyces sp. H10-C2]